eukprot:7374329-Alexandrium_andersonii.AAC.1
MSGTKSLPEAAGIGGATVTMVGRECSGISNCICAGSAALSCTRLRGVRRSRSSSELYGIGRPDASAR